MDVPVVATDPGLLCAAPCIPQGLRARLDCSMRVGSLTWEPSEGAETYVVNAEAADGHMVTLSTNDTSASISEFHCGQEYYLTVRAVGPNCSSRPSEPARLQTGTETRTHTHSQPQTHTHIHTHTHTHKDTHSQPQAHTSIIFLWKDEVVESISCSHIWTHTHRHIPHGNVLTSLIYTG